MFLHVNNSNVVIIQEETWIHNVTLTSHLKRKNSVHGLECNSLELGLDLILLKLHKPGSPCLQFFRELFVHEILNQHALRMRKINSLNVDLKYYHKYA